MSLPRVALTVALCATCWLAPDAHALTGASAVAALNAQRAANGIPGDLVERTDWTAACKAHNRYMELNNVFDPARTPAKRGYTKDGAWAAPNAVLGWDTWSAAPQPVGERAARADAAAVAAAHRSSARAPPTTTSAPPPAPGYLRAAPSRPSLYSYPGDGAAGVPYRQWSFGLPFTPGDFVGLPAGFTTGPLLYVMADVGGRGEDGRREPRRSQRRRSTFDRRQHGRRSRRLPAARRDHHPRRSARARRRVPRVGGHDDRRPHARAASGPSRPASRTRTRSSSSRRRSPTTRPCSRRGSARAASASGRRARRRCTSRSPREASRPAATTCRGRDLDPSADARGLLGLRAPGADELLPRLRPLPAAAHQGQGVVLAPDRHRAQGVARRADAALQVRRPSAARPQGHAQRAAARQGPLEDVPDGHVGRQPVASRAPSRPATPTRPCRSSRACRRSASAPRSIARRGS